MDKPADKDAQPAKRRKANKGDGSAARSEPVPARKFRGNRGKLAPMLHLPTEIFLEIARNMSPEDLLHMARAARGLRNFLMSKASKPIWRASWTFSNIPEPPPYFCEPFYTALIFDKLCLGCGTRRATRVDVACHIKLCSICFITAVLSKSFPKTMADGRVPKGLEPSERIGYALPYFGQTRTYDNINPGPFTWRTRTFSKDEFQSVLDEYMKLIEDPEAVETFLAERLTASNERVTFGRQISDWIKVTAEERRQHATEAVSARSTMIFNKLRELGYSDRYFHWTCQDESSWKWDSLIYQQRPLTDRIWSTIRPQLEKTIQLRREKKFPSNKSARNAELAYLYAKFQESFIGPNFLPWTILASVPVVATMLAADDYSQPLTREGWQWTYISKQLPGIVKRFHRMVVRDYLDVLFRDGDTNFYTNDNWAARFEKEKYSKIRGPTEDEISYVQRALSFFDTPQGIFSYDMLEEVGWWAPFSPVPCSVSRIARAVIAQMQLRSDIGMSQMLSLGNAFVCARCGSMELMSWLELLDHFKYQQKIFEDANAKKQMLGLDVPLFDCHSDAETSNPAILLSASEAQEFNDNSISHAPSRCSLCMSLDIDVTLSSQDEVQAHFARGITAMLISTSNDDDS